MTLSTLGAVVAASLATAAVAMALTALVARRLGKVSVVDIAWGLVFVAIGWVSFVVGAGSGRSLLLAALVTVWGGRLAWHIRRGRSGRARTRATRRCSPTRRPGSASGSPCERCSWCREWRRGSWRCRCRWRRPRTGRSAGSPLSGSCVWLVGVAFEGVGDAQLAAFKRDPANRGGVMDRGLWAWTRHPNYFGDAAVWWGLWLVSAEAWPGVLTVLSPVVMTYFLAFATGARLLESQMARRPGYPEYMERTSMFIPRPPKRS